ncbi:L-2,4-diaminobutyrate decarboxylase [Methylopila jiangsuensis]|uniref:L-2,4-diaminobutyrate decarboxylase n=1 Tax=Methylopila jiangsuensis TaxID=586230 RepID=A0A9W6JGR7_9HYPH|nr:aminotransferase class V-fold PLP-dependent enzyme [Methylopila jiangsuensis]MDR6286718.1 glutamate/tyrosine decarboxylase-like PLP-dependent enzyme [Methylopila jiangsuensis]GLK76937.1 L-2,4-diaminobutyrate decarboxylase [Methylopila jiangsuensis]
MFDRPSRLKASESEIDAALARLRAELLRPPPGPAATRPERAAVSPHVGVPARGRPLDEALDHMLALAGAGADRVDHPRFHAFVPGPAALASRIGDMAAATLNLQAGSPRQSPGAAAIERTLIRWLADAAGLPPEAGGLFLSGGSMANLAAVVAAREDRLSESERPRGVAYVTAETHPSVTRALRIAGLSRDRIRTVATDDRFRMAPGALEAAIARDHATGLRPFLIVATAGATATGAIDPLPDIAHIAERCGLWLHVDGALGATAALSPARRALLDGIGRADSLAWDGHKWLFQTYGCGMLLVRREAALTDAFRLDAGYLHDLAQDDGAPNFWDMGPETSRPARALKLWLTLQTLGLDEIAAAVDRACAHAETVDRRIAAMAGWRRGAPASLGVATFRCAPESLDDHAADALNAALAADMRAEGFAVVGEARLNGRRFLRLCALHPETTDDDLGDTLDRLVVHAARRL